MKNETKWKPHLFVLWTGTTGVLLCTLVKPTCLPPSSCRILDTISELCSYANKAPENASQSSSIGILYSFVPCHLVSNYFNGINISSLSIQHGLTRMVQCLANCYSHWLLRCLSLLLWSGLIQWGILGSWNGLASWILFAWKSNVLRMGHNVALEGRRNSATGKTWGYSATGINIKENIHT